MIRQAAVAGQFYPGNSRRVAEELQALWPAPETPRRRALAVMVPHAGWMYSGATAARVFAAVEVPERVILLGPNHHGVGPQFAVFDRGAWSLPSGEVAIDEPLTSALLAQSKLFVADVRAHQDEHCLEVQVPMLQRANPKVRIAPLLIGGGCPEAGGRDQLREIALALARAVEQVEDPVLLVASTDLNHYQDQETSNRKDRLALDAVVKLDEGSLLDSVRAADISMCGVAPTYVTVVAAKELGATRAELIDYRTSGDTSGDYTAVVGYGGVVIE